MTEPIEDPKPDVPPVPDPPVEPPTDPTDPPDSEAADDVAVALTALTETVKNLTEIVEGLVPPPGEDLDLPGDGKPVGDETPTKGPWHKRGLFN